MTPTFEIYSYNVIQLDSVIICFFSYLITPGRKILFIDDIYVGILRGDEYICYPHHTKKCRNNEHIEE